MAAQAAQAAQTVQSGPLTEGKSLTVSYPAPAPAPYHAVDNGFICGGFRCSIKAYFLYDINKHAQTCTRFICVRGRGCQKSGTQIEIYHHLISEPCPWFPPPPALQPKYFFSKCAAFNCPRFFHSRELRHNHSVTCDKYACPNIIKNGCRMQGTRAKVAVHFHAGVCFNEDGIIKASKAAESSGEHKGDGGSKTALFPLRKIMVN